MKPVRSVQIDELVVESGKCVWASNAISIDHALQWETYG